MTLLTRTGAGATKANLVADIRTAFVGAGFSESGILNGNSEQRSYGYPAGAETIYIAVDFNTSNPTEIRAVPAWGIDTAVDFDLQPRGPLSARSTLFQQTLMRPTPLAMVNTWVFYDEPVTDVVGYVHVVAEVAAGTFSHLCMGIVEKAGSFLGGAYTTGGSVEIGITSTNQSQMPFVRTGIVSQSQGQTWIAVDTTLLPGTVLGALASGGAGGGAFEFIKGEFHEFDFVTVTFIDNPYLCQDLMSAGIDARTGLTPMMPTYMTAQDTTNSIRVLIGTGPNVRYASVEGLPSGVNILTVGSDSWYVFPFYLAGTSPFFKFELAAKASDSGIMGIAHKLVP